MVESERGGGGGGGGVGGGGAEVVSVRARVRRWERWGVGRGGEGCEPWWGALEKEERGRGGARGERGGPKLSTCRGRRNGGRRVACIVFDAGVRLFCGLTPHSDAAVGKLG